MQPEPVPQSRSDAEIHTRIRALLDKLGVEPPAPDADLLEAGLLDSLGLIDLLAALELEFDFEIDLEEIDLEHFCTLDAMSAFVAARAPAPETGEGGPRLVDTSGAAASPGA